MLKINNLNATIDNKSILKGFSLNINPGEVHAIMGPNGSGKSTLSNILSGKKGYETSGEILFEGNVLHRDTVASMRMRCHIYSRHVRFSHAMKRLLEEAISAESDFAFALAMFTFCMGIQRRLMQLNRSVGNDLDPLR